MNTNNERTKIGLIGCGNISGAYLNTNKNFSFFDIIACADLDVERAKQRAEEYDIPKGCSVDELLADPEIEMVINLTIPQAHGPIAIRALQAGKSVYNEKPLAVSRDEAREMLRLAAEKGLRVGCAPDTFLGGGLQTCRKIIDDGWIGTPVAACGFMLSGGVETWHPNPEFFYKPGGGPMFDMGPYYLTAMVSMLGPVRRVTGSARVTHAQRKITSQPFAGQTIDVEVDTHVAGIMDFQSGAVATLITSFDIQSSPLPPITIFGTHGTLAVPDPNSFGGPIKINRGGEWQEIPLAFGYTGNSRGVGMADMALAMKQNRPHRASGELSYHVLDLMHAFHNASRENRHIEMQSTCERPAPLPLGLRDGELDA